MLAIIDYRTRKEAVLKLEKFADVLLFNAKNLVMPQLDGHPDLFIYQDFDNLVLAPNIPTYVIYKIEEYGIHFLLGQSEVKLPSESCSQYNCIGTESHFIHNQKQTDQVVRKINQHKKLLHTRQAFTRCSLTALTANRFITSDKNIEKVLLNHDINVLYTSPEMIEIPGFRHGLFGGTNGNIDGKIFFNGSLKSVDPDNEIRTFILESDYEIIELHDGPLFDGGSVFLFGTE